jgi:hypothetical protein
MAAGLVGDTNSGLNVDVVNCSVLKTDMTAVSSGAINTFAGGFVGDGDGLKSIVNCVFSGTLNIPTHGSGAVYKGGIMAYTSAGNSIVNSYWDTTTSGVTTPSAMAPAAPVVTNSAGKTTAELKAAAQTALMDNYAAANASTGLTEFDGRPVTLDRWANVTNGSTFPTPGGAPTSNGSATVYPVRSFSYISVGYGAFTPGVGATGSWADGAVVNPAELAVARTIQVSAPVASYGSTKDIQVRLYDGVCWVDPAIALSATQFRAGYGASPTALSDKAFADKINKEYKERTECMEIKNLVRVARGNSIRF